MKKILVSLVCILVAGGAFATGENIATSKAYVDTAVAGKQDAIPANDGAAQVLTNTGTPGAVGTKNIYDSNASYSEQTDSLITAGQFNTAVQNAIDTEFECVAWNPNDSTDCWLVQIRGVTDQSFLPTGYTALKYLVSDENECILTNIPWGNVYGFRGRAQQTVFTTMNKAIFGSSGYSYPNLYGTYYSGTTGEQYWYWAHSVPYTDIGEFNFTRIDDTDQWSGTVNNLNSDVGTIDVEPNDTVRLLCSASGSRWFPGNVWYLQLLGRNGEFLLNAIPVRRDSDGLVGFYDLVSGQMLTNSGTGTFIAGPDANNQYLPSGN